MTTPARSGDDVALTARLAEANGFDIDALPENRAGRLSDAQRRRLRARIRASSRNSWVPKGCCLLALGYLAYAIHAGSLVRDDALLIGFLAVVTGWVGFILPRYGLIRRVVRAGEVVHADGAVTCTERSAGAYHVGQGDSSYFYVLGDRQFRVSGVGHDALIEGRRYRIHYLPGVRTDRRQIMSAMVNIEALPDEA